MTEVNLKGLTEEYWDLDKKLPLPRKLEWYLKELLPHELKEAGKAGPKGKRHLPDPCDWLALLVGYSLEPLLQAIWAYQPTTVLLVLNKDYGDNLPGTDWGKQLQKLTLQLPNTVKPRCSARAWPPDTFLPNLDARPDRQKPSIAGDRPEEVFRFLRAWLLDEIRRPTPPRIVIDITGAKKSMVAGAYLFAAYAKLDVSYVDFDEYSIAYGKPYGYTCRISLLTNPFQAFRVRDWQRVRDQYERYAFRAARESLAEIIKAAVAPVEEGGDKALFEPLEIEAMERLVRLFEVYEHWENGDLYGANELVKSLPNELRQFHPPRAVTELARIWPHEEESKQSSSEKKKVSHASQLLDGARALEVGRTPSGKALPDLTTSLFLQDQQLMLYAHDELAKIGRLIKYHEDHRSALLRAAGLQETLLKARVMRLWNNCDLKLKLKPPNAASENEYRRSNLGDKAQSVMDEEIADLTGVCAMFNALEKQGKLKLYQLAIDEAQAADGKGYLQRGQDSSVRCLQPFWEADSAFVKDEFPKLRNKATHFCLSVPPDIAAKARQMVEANLEDYQKDWLDSSQAAVRYTKDQWEGWTSAMGWDELCKICGVTFLPPLKEATA